MARSRITLSDDLYYRSTVQAAVDRVPLRTFVEGALEAALSRSVPRPPALPEEAALPEAAPIVTDGEGSPLERPQREDSSSDAEHVKAVHEHTDKVTATSNSAFDAELKEMLDSFPDIDPSSGGGA
ncbi:MAG: hypothetical protein KF764_03065 [Labilithrix sp.]|nr:hypothetical protein [Labilithrix sp.]